MYRFKRESWVRKMQDTYSDCITTTNKTYGNFLTSQDYMDWGREWRNQKQRMDDAMMSPVPPSKQTRKGHYPRKYVPYISRAGYVGVWDSSKCLEHHHEDIEHFETQPFVKEIFTPRDERFRKSPKRDGASRKTRTRRQNVSPSRKVRDTNELQRIVLDKSIRLPDLKIHPLASREESHRRGIQSPPKKSCRPEMIGSVYHEPWKHFSVVGKI